jgi:hypothetical protein
MAALRAPKPLGVNVTLSWQLAPGASGEADAHILVWLKSPALAPVMVMPVMFSVAAPKFVSWTACGGLVVPVGCRANVSEFGAKLALVSPVEVATTKVIVTECIRDEEVPVMITG